MGTYKDGEMLLVSGFTNTTAQIPVALLQANRGKPFLAHIYEYQIIFV